MFKHFHTTDYQETASIACLRGRAIAGHRYRQVDKLQKSNINVRKVTFDPDKSLPLPAGTHG